MDRGAWRATVHGFAKSQTQLKRLSMHTHAGVTCISSPLALKPVDRRPRGQPAVRGVAAATDAMGGGGLLDLFAPCSKAKLGFGGNIKLDPVWKACVLYFNSIILIRNSIFMGKNTSYRKDTSEYHHSSFPTNIRPFGGNLCEKDISVFTKTLLAATSCGRKELRPRGGAEGLGRSGDHVTETPPPHARP